MTTASRERTLDVARRFAGHLVAGDPVSAHACLTAEARIEWSSDALADAYASMIEYGDGPAALDGFDEYLDDWADRHPADIGWAYVSIGGDGFAEAVTVIVADEDGEARVRTIEWGRP